MARESNHAGLTGHGSGSSSSSGGSGGSGYMDRRDIYRRQCAGVRAIESTVRSILTLTLALALKTRTHERVNPCYTKAAVLQQEHEQMLRRRGQSESSQADLGSSPFQGLPPSPSPLGRPDSDDGHGSQAGNGHGHVNSLGKRIRNRLRKRGRHQSDDYQYSNHNDHNATSQLSGEEAEHDSLVDDDKSLLSFTSTPDHGGQGVHSAAHDTANSRIEFSECESCASESAANDSFQSFRTAYVLSPSPAPQQDLINLNATPEALNAKFPVFYNGSGNTPASSTPTVQQMVLAPVLRMTATSWSEMFFWLFVYVVLVWAFALLVWDGVCGAAEAIGQWAWGLLCRVLMDLGV
ncbi:hypothetical protein BD289DRAFT_485253 [Coniella lustricola]|uniref:Uncharacterized protein n=1 Tax=Coniella lustricola TaxID=2025994 RepID=A0A2T2ZZ77_9PEZI|nr:hypothetical protein BD289DRAFT_485253 [Coniella lustricola]